MSHDPEPLSGPAPDPRGTPGRSGLPPDPLAVALANLEPAPVAVNRDRLMFAAGAASRGNVIRLWQFTAGILAAAGFAAGGMYFSRPTVVYMPPASYPAPREPERYEPEAQKPDPPPPEPEPRPAESAPGPNTGFLFTPMTGGPTPGAMGWLQMRNDVLTGGLGMLPDPNKPVPRSR